MNLVQEFEQYLVEDGKSPKTVASYLGDIKKFQNFLQTCGQNSVTEIKRFHITSFRNHQLQREQKPATINKAINSLNCYCQFLIQKGLLDPKEAVVVPKKDRVSIAAGSENEVAVFTEAEVNRILFYLENKEKVCQRNKLIIYLLLYTGVRVSELVTIRLKDIDYLTSHIRIRGKGGKIRDVLLRQDVLDLLKVYIKTERNQSRWNQSEYLLISQRSFFMHRDSVNTLLERISKELGIKCYPHKFRHTYCSLLIKRGVPITTVAKLAGHAGIQTTASYYISTSRQDKIEAVNLL